MNPYFTKASLVGMISDVLGYQLDPTQVQLSQAEPSVGFGTNREVQFHATFQNQQAEEETKTFYHFRLDLAELSSVAAFPEFYPVYESANTHHLLPYIRAYTGIPFTEQDLSDTQPIIDEQNQASFQIKLEALPGSLFFKGEHLMTVGRKPVLQSVITNNDLGSI